MPTFSRNCRRSSISRRMSRAMWRSVSLSLTSASQPSALALRARPHGHELLDLLPRDLGVRIAVAPLEVGDDALEARGVRPPPAVAVAVGDLDALAVRAVQEQVARGLVERVPRGVEVDAVLLGDRLGDLLVVLRRAARPRRQGALADRHRRIGYDQVRVDLHLRPEPRAPRAGAVR